MLTIRLQRTGKKNAAHFRIVVAEKTAHVSKKITEMLGSYNPSRKDFKVNEERAKYWISQHAELSPTIHNLFVDKGILKADKVKAFNVPKKEQAEAAQPQASETAAAQPAAESQQPAPAEPAPTETPEQAPETPTESTPEQAQ